MRVGNAVRTGIALQWPRTVAPLVVCMVEPLIVAVTILVTVMLLARYVTVTVVVVIVSIAVTVKEHSQACIIVVIIMASICDNTAVRAAGPVIDGQCRSSH